MAGQGVLGMEQKKRQPGEMGRGEEPQGRTQVQPLFSDEDLAARKKRYLSKVNVHMGHKAPPSRSP